MKTNINFQINVPNETRYLSLIGKICDNLAKEVCRSLIDRDTLAQNINTVLTEAMVNTIKHGFNSTKYGVIKIRISILENELLIRYFDSGQGFNLNYIPELTFDSDLLRECGRGIHIIKTLMDSVVYRKINGGNVLEMRKRLL